MPQTESPALRRDWLSKTLAGLLLGLTLAIGCSGIFARLASSIALPIKAQLTMWMVMPIWLGVLSGCFFFQSGKRAWLWLGAANIVVYGLLLAVRVF